MGDVATIRNCQPCCARWGGALHVVRAISGPYPPELLSLSLPHMSGWQDWPLGGVWSPGFPCFCSEGDSL